MDGRQGTLPPYVIQGDEDSQPDHYEKGNDQGRRPGRHGHRITTSLHLHARPGPAVRETLAAQTGTYSG